MNLNPTEHQAEVIWADPIDRSMDDPTDSELRQWAVQALIERGVSPCELAIKVVDENESQVLNEYYRNKDAPTNVLSFPMDSGTPDQRLLLGDIAICASIVRKEAASQNKTTKAHFAHMVVHGVMHLLGFDHEEEVQANEMESIETGIMKALGFADPYVESV